MPPESLSTAATVVIIGGGHAGGSVAAQLRQKGWQGRIVLVGEEPELPYQRPPLSKEWLSGEAAENKILLRAAPFYERGRIELRLSCRVTAIDRATRTVTIEDGEEVAYDHLVLATGARARPLPQAATIASGVHYLRSLKDAKGLAADLTTPRRLLIVGGGYIGLEVASSTRKLGSDVCIVEAAPRLLARVASPELADFYEEMHLDAGVRIDKNAALTNIETANGRPCAATLADGTRLACDTILAGIGAVPETALAEEAGLACDDGIVVDLEARTSDPAIFAIGDCARRPSDFAEGLVRIESVPNALEQAKQAAAAICGAPAPAAEVPWFWSHQYDTKLQIAGLMRPDLRRVVTRSGRQTLAVHHLDTNNRLITIEAVGAPEIFAAGRDLIRSRQPVKDGDLEPRDAALARP